MGRRGWDLPGAALSDPAITESRSFRGLAPVAIYERQLPSSWQRKSPSLSLEY
jgi:hypothetical protein